MAVKFAEAKRKNGDVLHLATSIPQVVGLTDALAGKQGSLTPAQLDAVNSGVTTEIVEKVGEIEAKIPAQATESNPLADKDFVNSTVQTMSAALITYDAAGNAFPTKASLTNATTVYSGGVEKAPDEHDYCVVLADEDHGDAQTRYTFSNGTWGFQFLVNDTPFTAEQNAAINSGITAEKVAGMGDYMKTADADAKYVEKIIVEGLGIAYVVPAGTDLSAFKDEDVIIEIAAE